MSYSNDKEKQRAYNKTWRETHPGYSSQWHKDNPTYFQNYCQKMKLKVLAYYGHGKPKCTMCGFDDIRALSIDHINGGGTKHCKKINRWGNGFYAWLIHNDFPLGFRTLCMNCQLISRSKK